MEEYGNRLRSSEIGNRGYEYEGTYVMPKFPGAFPDEVPEATDTPSNEKHELQGTITNNNLQCNDGPSWLGTSFDWQHPEDMYTVQPQQLSAEESHRQEDTRHHEHQTQRYYDEGLGIKPLSRSSSMPNPSNSSILAIPKPTRFNAKGPSKNKFNSGTKTNSTTPSNNIFIAVFGSTGTGKSSFISKLTGKDVKIGHGLQSCTSEIQEVPFKIGLRNVTLVDTPGFDDTMRSDTEILEAIAVYMKDAYDDKVKLTGVIYLHRISDIRMAGSSYKNLRMFRSLCGSKNLSHVILATTMWDKVSPEEGTAREGELLSSDKFWGQMKSHGSIVKRYDGTTGGATAMVNELVQKSPITLKIQQEVAIENKPLIDTKAGQEIHEALEDLSKKHADELAAIKQEISRALKEKDETLQRELEESRRKLAEQIKATEESKKALKRPVNRRGFWRRGWTCKGCGERLKKNNPNSVKGSCPICHMAQLFV